VKIICFSLVWSFWIFYLFLDLFNLSDSFILYISPLSRKGVVDLKDIWLLLWDAKVLLGTHLSEETVIHLDICHLDLKFIFVLITLHVAIIIWFFFIKFLSWPFVCIAYFCATTEKSLHTCYPSPINSSMENNFTILFASALICFMF
jgi:hypothetical protein